MAAQPRRRPSRGGTNRSISGDQRNLKVQGASARAKRPTKRMSTPDLCIQSGIAIETSPRGIPEAKDTRITHPVRQDLEGLNEAVKGAGSFTSYNVAQTESSYALARSYSACFELVDMEVLTLREDPSD